MDEVILVSCAKCKGFIPDPIGDGFGIGKCKVYEHYKDKGESQDRLDALFKNELGNKPFWRGNDDRDDRNCKKFVKL
jgi:hypothetical protein